MNLSGWMLKCNITEKTNMMQSLIQYFKNSRVAELDLSDCTVQLSCNQRQFALYFELEEKNVATSLWDEIHDDKIVAASVKVLNLSGFQLTINHRKLLLYQEISMLNCQNLQLCNLSERKLMMSKAPETGYHLLNILENLQSNFSETVTELLLENHILNELIPSNKIQEFRDCASKFVKLERISFSGCWFLPNEGGREEIIKSCLEFIPSLQEISIAYCHLSKDIGVNISRVIKSKSKRGIPMKINLEGCSGEGVQKLTSIINLSKFVYSEIDPKTNIMTVQKV